jgi:hypothetical protein
MKRCPIVGDACYEKNNCAWWSEKCNKCAVLLMGEEIEIYNSVHSHQADKPEGKKDGEAWLKHRDMG